MTTYTVTLDDDEHAAISAALGAGALQQRHAQLTELLRHNRDHYSIANAIEHEIDALKRAAALILMAQPTR